MIHRGARIACLLALMATLGMTSIAEAQLYINEIYFDPPGESGDIFGEYIELRGDPNMDLSNHYLIFLENEVAADPNSDADPGEIDYMFDLGSLSVPRMGSNGFLTLRQAGNFYGDPGEVSEIAPGTRDFENTTSSFTWSDTSGNSTVGFSGEAGKNRIENSGFTAMLIRNDGDPNTDAPFVPFDPNAALMDLDDNDDNELDPAGPLANWAVLDSIGINSEASDIDGMLYAPVNFSAGTPVGGGNVPAGAVFVDVGYEIEYIARWGDSTGSAETDWHATNLTNDGQAGFDGLDDYRQAGDPHGVEDPNIAPDPNSVQFVETSQGVPYGTILTDNFGSSNIFILDGDVNPEFNGEEYVFDGRVDGLDFLLIQQNLGFGVGLGPLVGATATRQHGDTNRDRIVTSADIAVWNANYGTTLTTASASPVPEPSTVVLLLGFLAVIQPRTWRG